MPDWEVLLQQADMVKMREASTHAQGKENIRLAIARCHVGVASSTPLSSPEFGQQNPLEDDAVET